MYALGIGAMKEVVPPCRIADFGRLLWAGDVRLAAAAELDLGARATIGEGDEQHDQLLSEPPPRPPPRRSDGRSRSARSQRGRQLGAARPWPWYGRTRGRNPASP